MHYRKRTGVCGPGLVLACTLAAAQASAEQSSERRPVFRLDPVADSVFLAGTLLVAATSEALIGTGEIEAQLPDDEAELLPIDRWGAERDSAALHGAQTSDVGVLVAWSWAVADTTFAALGDRPDSALTYLQSAVTTWCIANLFKLAVRRPRPRAYIELRETGSVRDDTQEALSFYSLHTAMVASVASTASYLVLTRPAPTWEKWLVVGGSIAATSVVGVGRALSAAHFTTDIIAGAGAGVAVGVLVPHVHRVSPVSIAAAADGSGGTLGIHGVF